MDPLWKKILVVALWVAFTVWFIQPVPGKGLPIGRRYFRFYLNRRQAVVWGGVLVAAGVLVTLAGLGAEQNVVVLFAFCDLAWRSLSLPGNPDEKSARQRRG